MSWAGEEANRAISESLEGWVGALPPDETIEAGGDTGMLGDWVAVVSMVRVNREGLPVTHYYLAMKGGAMLPHVVRGLLYQGLEEVNVGMMESE